MAQRSRRLAECSEASALARSAGVALDRFDSHLRCPQRPHASSWWCWTS